VNRCYCGVLWRWDWREIDGIKRYVPRRARVTADAPLFATVQGERDA